LARRYDVARIGLDATQILIDGDLLIGRRSETRALALQWAEMERPTTN
jgi:hypothetical protein